MGRGTLESRLLLSEGVDSGGGEVSDHSALAREIPGGVGVNSLLKRKNMLFNQVPNITTLLKKLNPQTLQVLTSLDKQPLVIYYLPSQPGSLLLHILELVLHHERGGIIHRVTLSKDMSINTTY